MKKVNFEEIFTLLSKRLELLKKLQDTRGSIVITYASSDSMELIDAVIMYTVLNKLSKEKGGKFPVIDLFLSSGGGDIDAAYRLINIIRQYCDTLNIIVPFYAKSAATLLCLGADKLVMGPPSELGPIDPQVISKALQFYGPVQAIRDCIDYIYEKLKEADNLDVMRSLMYPIIDKIDPWILGNFERQVKVSKQYAYQLLKNYMLKDKSDDCIIEVSKKLTEEYYSHGYVIGKNEGRGIGLVIEEINDFQWDIIWDLYLTYFEQFTKMNKKITLIESELTLDFELKRIKNEFVSVENVEPVSENCNSESGPGIIKKTKKNNQ
jgi:hypothetical protein